MNWFSLGDEIQFHLIKVEYSEVKLHKAIHFALTNTSFPFGFSS